VKKSNSSEKKSNCSVKKSNFSVKKILFFTLSSVRKSRFVKEKKEKKEDRVLGSSINKSREEGRSRNGNPSQGRQFGAGAVGPVRGGEGWTWNHFFLLKAVQKNRTNRPDY
jgi:hypothetical protein